MPEFAFDKICLIFWCWTDAAFHHVQQKMLLEYKVASLALLISCKWASWIEVSTSSWRVRQKFSISKVIFCMSDSNLNSLIYQNGAFRVWTSLIIN